MEASVPAKQNGVKRHVNPNMKAKATDSIPRVGVGQIFQVLRHIQSRSGKSSFDEVRLFLLDRSERTAPFSRSAMYTSARDVLIDLQKLGLIEAGVLPRTQSQLDTHSESPCELTEAGRSLAAMFIEKPGHGFDQLLLLWMNNHSYFRAFIAKLEEQPLYVPDITNTKQIDSEVLTENVEEFSRRLAERCLKRLSAISYSEDKAEVFRRTLRERAREIGLDGFAEMESKKIVDNIQDKIVLPAFLTAEELPFSDAVTFQYVLKAAKDFFAASSTSSHPAFSLRVIFPTCEFRPSTADSAAKIDEVIHHGKAFATPHFISTLKSAYDQIAVPPGSYVDAYALRAVVSINIQIQPKVFTACLSDLISAGPSPDLTIYTELPFDPRPAGEDYVEIGRNRIGLIKLVTTKKGE
jgi:hypothetical protein